METQTIITPKFMVQVKTLKSSTGQKPHDIIREFVAEAIGSNELDFCFEKAYKTGLMLGTNAYDECIQIILDEIGIPFSDVREHLLLKGIKL